MNEPEDPQSDDTLRDYARASAAQAGRPADATRAAILAQAHAVAAVRRVPAANEPWFSRRVSASIAASLAVMGIALVLWRQVGQEPQAQPQLQSQVAAADNALREDATTQKAEQASTPPAAASGALREQAASEMAAQGAAPAPRQASESTPARARAPAANDALASESDKLDAEDLLRREFPQVFQSAAPPTGVWLVQDASGRTVSSGTLDAGQSFGSVTLRLQQEMPGRRVAAFDVRIVATERGATVQLGYARVE